VVQLAGRAELERRTYMRLVFRQHAELLRLDHETVRSVQLSDYLVSARLLALPHLGFLELRVPDVFMPSLADEYEVRRGRY
jgi:hypothetical protein